jgi:hypothetical protein
MILAVFVVACSSTLDPGAGERRIGLISGFNQDDPRIATPDTVVAGVPFAIEVTTYGDGCTRRGETEASFTGRRVVVTPYDYVSVAREHCEDILLEFLHAVEVEFLESGPVRVEVLGRDWPLGKVTLWVRDVFVRADPVVD